MADTNTTRQRTLQGTASSAQDLILDGLPRCTIQVTDDGTWHVMTQLAAEGVAALAAAAPNPDALCQQAQHALGLAGIGSRIERGRNSIGVYAAPLRSPSGEATLLLDGREVLWWVSQASSEAIRAVIAAATSAMRTAPDT
jgi:hypothetical protein